MKNLITKNKHLVRMHNNFIQAIFNLSVDAKKLLLLIWLHANESGKDIQVYRKDVMEKVGIDLKNLSKEHREKIIEELMTKIITIRDIDNPNNFTKIQLVYKTKYENGILYTNIDEELMKYIKEAREKLFTRFKIQNIKPLSSIYAIRIYLFCKQFEDTGWLKVSLEEFKQILEIGKKYNKVFDLKRRVLEVAKKQINENTDILIDYELEKQGRRYVNIIFKIQSKNKEKKIKEVKLIETDNSFNYFKKEVLSKVNENQVIILNDNIYKIKHKLLYLDDKLLDKEEALDHWHLLYENKDRIEIKNIEELKKENLKKLENKLNESYKGKKTFIIVNGEELKVIVVKVEVVDIDKIKVIFKAENGKFYMAEYSSIDSLKNL